jgi:hypothetical protein
MFPSKSERRTVTIEPLGTARTDRFGNWVFDEPISVGTSTVELIFESSNAPPGTRELSFVSDLQQNWQAIWTSILRRVENELQDDGPEGNGRNFFAKLSPLL